MASSLPRVLSLCSGIGVFDAVFRALNMQIAGQVENNVFCLKVLAKHFPDVVRIPDLYTVKGDEFGPIDVVVAGFPCQPFSYAGKRHGQKDDRHLWPQVSRVIEATRPSVVLLENVVGLISLALDDVLTDLEALHYAARTFVFPACATGAPQRRERVFIIATSPALDDANCNRFAYSAPDGQESSSEWVSCPTDAFNTGTYGSAYTGTQGDFQTGESFTRDDSSTFFSLAHSTRGGRQERFTTPLPTVQGESTWSTAAYRDEGLSQSGLGRDADGTSPWLDRGRIEAVRWPALPHEVQHAWEPPRTISTRLVHHAARLSALGNAVVWDQAYAAGWVVAQLLADAHHTEGAL